MLTCQVCPHNCELAEGQIGKCLVRRNEGGIKDDPRISTIVVDPIEKKPLLHFYPGTKFMSVGFRGCNAVCLFCLPGDTLISVPGGLKRLDQIQDGDEIIAVENVYSVPRPVPAHVGHIFDREVEEVIELEVDGKTIQLTPEHPVLTKRGWVRAEDLTTDDEVLYDKTCLKQLRSLL